MSSTTTTADSDLGSDVALAVSVLLRIGAAAQLAQVDGEVALGWVRDLQRVAGLAEAASSVLAVRADECGVLREAGFRSVASFLTDAGLSGAHAGAVSARGKALRHFPKVRAAVLDGAITVDAARVITTGVTAAVADLPKTQRAAQRAVAEEILLPIAQGSPMQDLHNAVDAIGFYLDPEGAAARALNAAEKATLSCARVGEQYVVHGTLPIDAGAALVTLLEQRVDQMYRSGSVPPELAATDDEAETTRRRTIARPRLWAQAFRELVLGVLSDGAVGTTRAQAPHVLLLVDQDDHAQGKPGVVLVPGQGPVPVPAETVERILCDAEVTEVHVTATVPDAYGRTSLNGLARADRRVRRTAAGIDPHDLTGVCSHVQCVGRRSRTATKAQWAALIARDRHCRFPGCTLDPSRCEAHHVRTWQRGGATCLSNLVLVCARHHQLVHEGHWTIATDPDLDIGHPDRWSFTPPENGRYRHLHLGWTALLNPAPPRRQ